MEQVKTKDWMRHTPKILKAGAVLAIIGVVVPSVHAFEISNGESLVFFMWFIGFYWISLSGEVETGFVDELTFGDEYMTVGIIATVLLVFACILMGVGSYYVKGERNNKLSAGTGLLGGVLAFISPAVFYYGIKEEIPSFWGADRFDPSIGIYLPIIAGILAIIGAVAAGYTFSLGSKGELRKTTPYQPTPDKPAITKDQQESPTFCKNCGTRLTGNFCQGCGQKAAL